MRRPLSFLACAVLPFLFACGHQLSDQLDGGGCPEIPGLQPCPGTTCGGGHPSPVCSDGQWTCPVDEGTFCPAPQDAGPSDDGGGCTGTPPELYCSEGCGQYGWYTAGCIGNQWSCPEFGVPFCDFDAAYPDACAYGSPISCPGPTSCGGFPYPTCSDGVWSCADAGSCPEDAGPPPSFSCGDLACDPATSYCQIDTGGPVLPDGGVGSSYTCVPLPSSCNGVTASCACVEATQGGWSGCGCVENSGDVIFTCAVP